MSGASRTASNPSESSDILGLDDGVATVSDLLVGAGSTELEPCLDDVDQLQAVRLHCTPERARGRLHVGRDRTLSVGIRRVSRLARHGSCLS